MNDPQLQQSGIKPASWREVGNHALRDHHSAQRNGQDQQRGYETLKSNAPAHIISQRDTYPHADQSDRQRDLESNTYRAGQVAIAEKIPIIGQRPATFANV